MKAFDTLTAMKFEQPMDIINYFTTHGITCVVDPDTRDRVYVINPETRRNYTYVVKETSNKKYLYLVKV